MEAIAQPRGNGDDDAGFTPNHSFPPSSCHPPQPEKGRSTMEYNDSPNNVARATLSLVPYQLLCCSSSPLSHFKI